MSITVLTNAQIFVNTVDLSDHVTKVTIEDMRASVDVTAMGAVNTAVAKGLGDGKITIDFLQDFAAAKVHATLQPLIGSAVAVAVEVRPVNGARSATNPASLLAGALLMNYSMLDGKVGDASGFTAVFVNASQAGMTYPTS